MKRGFVICLLLSINIVTNAQGYLSGKISDKVTGEAIAGATIYFPELKIGDISDNNGFYRTHGLPKIITSVQVSFLSYQSIFEKVDLGKTTSLDFELEPSITEMNEVVITGTSKATEISRNPVPIITLTNNKLQQNLYTNIIDAISKLPGISAVTTGPNVSKPFIHGLGYNRVLTLFDGVRQEGQQWGDEHGTEIDENMVNRIEIIKGPASLTYGPDALAGVVNLIPLTSFHQDTIQGHVTTNYQTNNGLFSISGAMTGNRNGFIWGGVETYKMATNYRNKYDGRVYGTGFRETDLSGYIGLNKQWGYSHLNFSLFNDLQEIPDGSRDSITRKFTKQITEYNIFRPIATDAELKSYKITTLHQHIQHYRLYSSNSFFIGYGELAVTLGYQQNIRKEFSHPEYPDVEGMYLDLKTLTYDIKYSTPEIAGWGTTVGLNGMYQHNANKGTEFVIPDYSVFDVGPFVLLTKKVNKLDLSAGIRYDTRIFRNDAMYTIFNPITGFDMQVTSTDTARAEKRFYSLKQTFSGISGSFGATYNITKKLLIKSNIARGFRAPNIAEISSNGVHPGSLIYQIGNNSFKPEFSLQEDFGINYRSDHVSGDLDIFNNNISNYIYNHKLLNDQGADSVIIKGNQTFKFEEARAQLYGWEASLDVHPFDWLHFENSISVIYALNKGSNSIKVTDSSKYLPFIPPMHTSSELQANIPALTRHLRSLYIKFGVEYYARQNRVYLTDNTETPTPGYVLFDVGIGADITGKDGKILASINILGNNITDVAYQSHLSRLKYFEQYPGNPSGRSGIYNMGRNISFKLMLPLDFK